MMLGAQRRAGAPPARPRARRRAWWSSASRRVVYWLCNRYFDAGRGDFFYLADAFLHGRTWLDFRPGPNDVIVVGDRFYVPFAPFPAIALMPVVAVLGAVTADQVESGINALLAAAGVGLCWMLLGRIGVGRLRDRLALTVLFGFSTQILWVTTRGGVWHTGQLIATILTLLCLIEIWGSQRAWLDRAAGRGRLPDPGAAGLRDPVLCVACSIGRRRCGGSLPVAELGRGWRSASCRRSSFFFLYNQVRFGSPLESGYALATLPPLARGPAPAGPVRAGRTCR